MSGRDDIARAADALQFIPSDLPRDEWIKVGMAAQAAGLGFDEFDAWSAGGSSYNARDVASVWRSFKPNAGIGAGTLFKVANDYGWSKTAPRLPDVSRLIKTAQERRKEVSQSSAKSVDVEAVWERFEHAGDHPYIESKQGVSTGLRVVPAGDPLRIAGQSVVGWLAVPARNESGALQSMQFIPTPGPGKKLNLPGAPMSGASFVVGNLVTGGTIYVVEGVGQAWACWKATGHPAIVAFGSGNMKRVATDLRQKDKSAKIVIVPDVGTETKAEEIARELNAAVAFMPEDEPNNFDASDYGLREGFDALEHLLSQATEPPALPMPEPLLKRVSVGDVLTAPSEPPSFAWHGLLPHGVVSLLSAHGGTGKSFVGLMLAVASATGRPLFGVPTTAAPAVFVSLEDSGSIVRHRLAKICNALNIDPATIKERLHIVDGSESPELFTADHRGAGEITSTYDELAQLVEETRAGLVIVDNASDAFGGDEINRRQVRAFMRALAKIAKDSHCAVLLLAHVDKSTSRNKFGQGDEAYSGSTAWHNSARSRLFMSRDGDSGNLTIQHQKSNLGEIQEPIVIAWPQGGIPALANELPDIDGVVGKAQERVEDRQIKTLLKMIDEFASRDQFISSAPTAKNNAFAVLRPEPEFKALKMSRDDVARLITKCQRDGLIDVLDYRTKDRKDRQRWVLTDEGREFAGLSAPSAPSAPSSEEGAESAQGAAEGAPSAPSCVGGMGGESARRTWRKT